MRLLCPFCIYQAQQISFLSVQHTRAVNSWLEGRLHGLEGSLGLFPRYRSLLSSDLFDRFLRYSWETLAALARDHIKFLPKLLILFLISLVLQIFYPSQFELEVIIHVSQELRLIPVCVCTEGITTAQESWLNQLWLERALRLLLIVLPFHGVINAGPPLFVLNVIMV